MNKSVRFIFVFFAIIISSFLLNNFVYAGQFIKPIPDEIEGRNVTFGQLLNKASAQTQETEGKVLGVSKVKEFLARLEDLKDQSWEEFQNNQITQYGKNKQHLTYNSQQETNLEPSTTPFIPVPTLIAGVNEIVQNNPITQSSNNPKTNNLQTLANTGVITDNPIKTTYTIALLGDSMVDTLGADLPHLQQLLKAAYPNYSFALLNFGQGATDMDQGLYRLTNATNYLGKYYPPLLSFKPDILVVESFAYNHWSGQAYDLDRQWLTIAKIIDKVKEASPDTKIILSATIGPNVNTYGDGKLNWPVQLKWDSSLITRAYLQNLINFATSENYPLADTYHPSIGTDGNGLEIYINQGDHLHPSDTGKLLFSQKIVEAIKTYNLIK